MRDIFLFCCYTGLAYIDVKTLTTENLVQKADVYKMPESEYRARKSRKLRRELQEFALANGVTMMN